MTNEQLEKILMDAIQKNVKRYNSKIYTWDSRRYLEGYIDALKAVLVKVEGGKK